MTTSTTPTHQPPDVHTMVVVHRVFRREFGAIPNLVRVVADGDTVRATVVADHLRLVLAGLEMHHTGEDVLLWPLLLERAAPSTGLIETMQAQHHAVDEHAAAISPMVDAWQAAPTRAAGEDLARHVEQFATHLLEHLDLEEREVLPLVSRHITAVEWDRLGEHGRELMTRQQLPIMFGLVLEDTDDAERAALLSGLPTAVRLVVRTLGAWQISRYVKRLRAA